MTDRLEEIKARTEKLLDFLPPSSCLRNDWRWLIAEVERLRESEQRWQGIAEYGPENDG